jgi:hypothetical protein
MALKTEQTRGKGREERRGGKVRRVMVEFTVTWEILGTGLVLVLVGMEGWKEGREGREGVFHLCEAQHGALVQVGTGQVETSRVGVGQYG